MPGRTMEIADNLKAAVLSALEFSEIEEGHR